MRFGPRAGRLVTIALASSLLAGAASGATVPGDRDTVSAAVADIHATINDIVQIENGFAIGHANYVAAAQRARNGLVGTRDPEYVASAGMPGDADGAIAHLDALLDRKDDSVWTPAVQGAKINLLAAAQSLSDSLHEKQMEDYETDLTVALSDLSLALGRPSESGVLGGIAGALAATSLAVPAGATVVPGCRPPASAPSYGIVDGNLTFVSMPRSHAELAAPTGVVVDRIAIEPKRVVFYTRPRSDAARLCAAASIRHLVPIAAHTRAALQSHVRTVADAGATSDAAPAAAPAATAGSAVAYTQAQAHAGAAIYASSCVSCHGANLAGVAGPAVAGKEFLAQAATNKWTVADLRNLVVQQMPLNNPGSLTPKQYADVIGFLLASNCFPASTTPFPEQDSPAFAQASFVAPPAPVPATNTTLQTCAVQ